MRSRWNLPQFSGWLLSILPRSIWVKNWALSTWLPSCRYWKAAPKSPPTHSLAIGRCTSVSLLCETFALSLFHTNSYKRHALFLFILQNSVISTTSDFMNLNNFFLGTNNILNEPRFSDFKFYYSSFNRASSYHAVLF